jgi:uncharacterized repeat protein (TIGR03803 family)
MRVNLLLLFALSQLTLRAQILTTLHTFTGSDGATPRSGVIQGSDGNFYGTTSGGGANNAGTIFRVASGGRLTTLYSFCEQTNCTDGSNPSTPLLQAIDGGFYGTTQNGGAAGFGTFFRITLDGAFKTVYNFCAQTSCADGGNPEVGLVQAADGYLWGATQTGGANGAGAIFKIAPNGSLTPMYAICSQPDCADGRTVSGALVQALNGNFYGAMTFGGSEDGLRAGGGTLFEITPSGVFSILHTFCPGSACGGGFMPSAGLTPGKNGLLYGTTTRGGLGVIFTISLNGDYSELCSSSGCPEGLVSPLLLASDGNFYGTIDFGGPTSYGAIFQVTPAGGQTSIYSFCQQTGCPDGAYPTGNLIQGTDGAIYGTTSGQKGDDPPSDDGSVFRLSVGLGPFVESQPASAQVGGVVRILGTNLTGASELTFNGVRAGFTVASSSEIVTKVPVGATTGTIEVVVPSGTLSSKGQFFVIPSGS